MKDLLKISNIVSKLPLKKTTGINYPKLNQSFILNIKKFKYVVSYNDCSIHNIIVKDDKLYYVDINPRKISLAPLFYEYYCQLFLQKLNIM